MISVDTKKKELVGDFKNARREWRPQGEPEEVRVHDFLIKELGRAVPYGIYDLAANAGWVSVGIDHDTAAFAVQTIRRWWHDIGRQRYPHAPACLMITADGGGSNGSRVRLWKRELQTLADELGIEITVHHLPPGTSKWNKIEHRLFSFITMNWRAKPLVSYRVIVDLIGATTTRHRPDGALRTRHQPLSQGHRRLRPGDGRPQHHPRRLPRRMELHHPASSIHQPERLIPDGPLAPLRLITVTRPRDDHGGRKATADHTAGRVGDRGIADTNARRAKRAEFDADPGETPRADASGILDGPAVRPATGAIQCVSVGGHDNAGVRSPIIVTRIGKRDAGSVGPECSSP